MCWFPCLAIMSKFDFFTVFLWLENRVLSGFSSERPRNKKRVPLLESVSLSHLDILNALCKSMYILGASWGSKFPDSFGDDKSENPPRCKP